VVASARDIVVIGAGHNALVATFYLASKGFKPLVLERRHIVGGVAVTGEFHPGFKCSSIAHTCDGLLPQVVQDLQLTQHGLSLIEVEASVSALSPDGSAIITYTEKNPAKSAETIRKFSSRDAEKYLEFHNVLLRIGQALRPLLTMTPPDIEKPSTQDLWRMAKVGRGIRRLGKKDMQRLLRWGPMPVADFAAEWFETELLRAAITGRGIFGTVAGPFSPGTMAPLLLRVAAEGHPTGRPVFPRDGMGALTQAMAAAVRAAGGEIRVNAAVEKILVKDGAACGVVLEGGEEIAAKAVVSGADPKRTLLKLVDPVHLDPNFLVKMQHYRSRGLVAKVHLALAELPTFTALAGDATGALGGRIHIGPEVDYIERAFDASKYGEFSPRPYLDVTIPTFCDPSLAPTGQHVMSIFVHYAPYHLKSGDWPSRREALGDAVVDTLAEYAPDLPRLLLGGEVITPDELEDTYGLTGGHILHGDLALDQLFTMRPLLGWARYRTPVRGLYLCGSGTHPGAGMMGASGFNAAREILRVLRR
jgi:phytoene dehydrogenase-like protein